MAEFVGKCILLKNLKIYQWIFAICGFNLPPFLIYRKEKDTKYYTLYSLYLLYTVLLIILVIWSVHCHIALVIKVTTKYGLDKLTRLSAHCQNVLIVILQLQMVYKVWFASQNLKNILSSIENLENKIPFHLMERQFCRRLLSRIGICLIILSLMIFYLNFQLIAQDMVLGLRLINILFLISVQLKSLEYGIYIQVVYEFLEYLYKSLKGLNEKLCKEPVKQRTQPIAFHYVKSLKQNQLFLLEICILVEKLEKYFAWPIIMLFFFNGISILCTVNWGYVRYIYETQHLNQMYRLIYVGILLVNMLLLSYLAQKCISKYKKFSPILLNFRLYPHDVQMNNAVREYTLQLMHHPLKFTCNGYMDINLGYYGKVNLVIFLYVLILIQFKMTDVSEGTVKATKYIFGRY